MFSVNQDLFFARLRLNAFVIAIFYQLLLHLLRVEVVQITHQFGQIAFKSGVFGAVSCVNN